MDDNNSAKRILGDLIAKSFLMKGILKINEKHRLQVVNENDDDSDNLSVENLSQELDRHIESCARCQARWAQICPHCLEPRVFNEELELCRQCRTTTPDGALYLDDSANEKGTP